VDVKLQIRAWDHTHIIFLDVNLWRRWQAIVEAELQRLTRLPADADPAANYPIPSEGVSMGEPVQLMIHDDADFTVEALDPSEKTFTIEFWANAEKHAICFDLGLWRQWQAAVEAELQRVSHRADADSTAD
jgi:hypothetical protein